MLDPYNALAIRGKFGGMNTQGDLLREAQETTVALQERVDTLARYAQAAQYDLWHDLETELYEVFEAQQLEATLGGIIGEPTKDPSAPDIIWSDKAAKLTERLGSVIALVGPTSRYGIPTVLVFGGVYEALVVAAGAEFEPATTEEVESLSRHFAHASIGSSGQTLEQFIAEMTERFKPTIAAIRNTLGVDE